ncbi:hypothetical protein QQS21_004315, partial [Conoideocrella luteorostrata]
SNGGASYLMQTASVIFDEMFSIAYEKIEHLPGGDHIRILTLSPSQDPTDPILVSLSVASLADEQSYEALSYCWGDSAHRRLIFCDGKPFPVTENLESALRHLRLAEIERVLWVDAICINQDDVSERAYEVRLMRQIYQRANRVVIWLGDGDGDSDLVFPLCERLIASNQDLLADNNFELDNPEILWGPRRQEILKQRLDRSRRRGAETESDGSQRPDDEDIDIKDPKLTSIITDGQKSNGTISGDKYVENEVSSEEATALLRLISRPWFTRCWVLQEACLGLETLVVCGAKSLDWENFYIGVSLALVLSDGALTGRPEQLLGSGLTLMMLMRGKVQLPNKHEYVQHIDFLWVLWEALKLHATDARDKIYSVLGLLDPDESNKLGLAPDYTISVEECFKRAALAIMSYTKNLDVLLTDRVPESTLSSPSWVPDWSYRAPPVPAMLVREEDRNDLGKQQSRQFRASGSDQWDPTGKVNGDTLKLSGYVIDRIMLLEDTLTVPRLDHVAVAGMTSSRASFTGFWKTVGKGLGSYFDTLVAWEKLAFSREYSKYPTGEDAETAFAITLCAGNIASPESALSGYKKWRKTLRGPKKMSFLKGLGANGGIYKSLVAATGIITGLGNLNDRVYGTATERTLYRRLARTEKGYLAIVPRQSAVGDHIALFRGGKTPFITRMVTGKDQFELIGPTYVHGIMYGEAWNEALTRDVDII